jgi:oxygen-independent coproporphyrinogen-3 oxidase
MSGIYLHIPFCKQACSYCDFHFSTSLKRKKEMLSAMKKELEIRQKELETPIKSIYLGGGTPSLLHPEEVEDLFSHIRAIFQIEADAEVTLEVNPDDLDGDLVKKWSKTPVNRLSIGIQSFSDDDLRFMNRAHDRSQALRSLQEACHAFENISIDLIYGVPGMTEARWKKNLKTAFEFPIQHISSYALTVEPRTALHHYIRSGRCDAPSEDTARSHYEILIDEADRHGFSHYEVSNFAKTGYLSRHNTSYWQGESYLGIGPSAHSYSGRERSWNIANNAKYLRALEKGEVELEKEFLSQADRLNELVMTRLRTTWGLSLSQVEEEFGMEEGARIRHLSERFVEQGLLELKADHLVANRSGFFLIDGIASDLFIY